MKTRAMLTLEDCRKISAAAEAEAKKNNWNVCISIVDDGGHQRIRPCPRAPVAG
jgi:glc operon protein GlcG